MFKLIQPTLLLFFLCLCISCNEATESSLPSSNADSTGASGGQEKVKDDVSQKDVVKTAVSSKDHTTLIVALKKADLVTSLSNAGPFTVFAPVNAAFEKLPAGTLDELLKDQNKEDLRNILQYHVTLSTLKPRAFRMGRYWVWSMEIM